MFKKKLYRFNLEKCEGKMLFTETLRRLKDLLLNITVCPDQVVFVHVGHHSYWQPSMSLWTHRLVSFLMTP